MPSELHAVMQIFKTGAPLQSYIQRFRQEGKKIGFVPTMGALHSGHLSLIQASQEHNDVTLCSIYVNPTQFNQSEDLEKYPRTLDADIEKLKSVACDALYLPSDEELYPDGPRTEQFDYGPVADAMEGKHRPGHFNGVGTIVSKLFAMTHPHRAYFGEKDFQQLAIIRRLVELKKIPVEIIGCPIARDSDGLALSSRNMRLNHDQRQAAPQIFAAMKAAAQNLSSYSPEALCDFVSSTIEQSSELQVEYVEIADESQLSNVNQWSDFKRVRLFVAVWAGEIRLIDNLHLF